MSLPERLPLRTCPHIRAEIELPPVERAMPVSPFVGAAPKVTLQRDESTLHPFALAIAAAWSCYGGKPARVENVRKLIGPAPEGLSEEKAADRDDAGGRAQRLYSDLFAAGHHTTLQHANFVFVLDNVSRLAIWSFFHSPPVLQLGAGLAALPRSHRRDDDDPRSSGCREQEIYANAIERACRATGGWAKC